MKFSSSTWVETLCRFFVDGFWWCCLWLKVGFNYHHLPESHAAAPSECARVSFDWTSIGSDEGNGQKAVNLRIMRHVLNLENKIYIFHRLLFVPRNNFFMAFIAAILKFLLFRLNIKRIFFRFVMKNCVLILCSLLINSISSVKMNLVEVWEPHGRQWLIVT